MTLFDVNRLTMIRKIYSIHQERVVSVSYLIHIQILVVGVHFSLKIYLFVVYIVQR